MAEPHTLVILDRNGVEIGRANAQLLPWADLIATHKPAIVDVIEAAPQQPGTILIRAMNLLSAIRKACDD